MEMIPSTCNQSISLKWMEPPKVEDKNREVNSTQSILFQSNLLWEYSPEIIYSQQLHQISNMIANKFDK